MWLSKWFTMVYNAPNDCKTFRQTAHSQLILVCVFVSINFHLGLFRSKNIVVRHMFSRSSTLPQFTSIWSIERSQIQSGRSIGIKLDCPAMGTKTGRSFKYIWTIQRSKIYIGRSFGIKLQQLKGISRGSKLGGL